MAWVEVELHRVGAARAGPGPAAHARVGAGLASKLGLRGGDAVQLAAVAPTEPGPNFDTLRPYVVWCTMEGKPAARDGADASAAASESEAASALLVREDHPLWWQIPAGTRRLRAKRLPRSAVRVHMAVYLALRDGGAGAAGGALLAASMRGLAACFRGTFVRHGATLLPLLRLRADGGPVRVAVAVHCPGLSDGAPGLVASSTAVVVQDPRLWVGASTTQIRLSPPTGSYGPDHAWTALRRAAGAWARTRRRPRDYAAPPRVRRNSALVRGPDEAGKCAHACRAIHEAVSETGADVDAPPWIVDAAQLPQAFPGAVDRAFRLLAARAAAVGGRVAVVIAHADAVVPAAGDAAAATLTADGSGAGLDSARRDTGASRWAPGADEPRWDPPAASPTALARADAYLLSLAAAVQSIAGAGGFVAVLWGQEASPPALLSAACARHLSVALPSASERVRVAAALGAVPAVAGAGPATLFGASFDDLRRCTAAGGWEPLGRPTFAQRARSAAWAVTAPAVAWADVCGADAAKALVRDTVLLPLAHPEAFRAMGCAPPAGLLLYGPPGTGKTLLAKALATALGFHFLSASTADLVRGVVGEAEAAVAALMAAARENSPCVVFLDEFQSAFGTQEEGEEVGARMLSQLRRELDVNAALAADADRRVVCVAATNTPWAVDPALLRPGRLGVHVLVAPPDRLGRRQLAVRVNPDSAPRPRPRPQPALTRPPVQARQLERLHGEVEAEGWDADVVADCADGLTGAEITGSIQQALVRALAHAGAGPEPPRAGGEGASTPLRISRDLLLQAVAQAQAARTEERDAELARLRAWRCGGDDPLAGGESGKGTSPRSSPTPCCQARC